MIAQYTVVRNVHVGHEQAMAAYDGRIGVGSASIDGDVLADGGKISDFSGGFFALEFEILRNAGDNRARENLTSFADAGTIENSDMGTNPGIVADYHIAVNVAERTDLDVLPDFCCGMNHREGVNIIH